MHFLEGGARNKKQEFVFRFRQCRYRISCRKKNGKFVILWIDFREDIFPVHFYSESESNSLKSIQRITNFPAFFLPDILYRHCRNRNTNSWFLFRSPLLWTTPKNDPNCWPPRLKNDYNGHNCCGYKENNRFCSGRVVYQLFSNVFIGSAMHWHSGDWEQGRHHVVCCSWINVLPLYLIYRSANALAVPWL